ncbi:DNA-3-methyladenine glycosylase family protein [Rubritepida flocculans]|uniref:DNA-3-methyladenine glycosylase family protein n=1 Tax=Rubritepida flocculans TaxID=182403 RepID=UPI0004255931|nr:DNA-3-methyladenine glycosylase [Rubritepida flocculans]
MTDWSAAERKLSRAPRLRGLVRRIGPCTLAPRPREPYEALVRAIAHQQVHGRAAEAMLSRLIALHPEGGFPPPRLLAALPEEALRGCGFSAAKCAAIRDIAEASAAGRVPSLAEAAAMADEALVERLLPLRGVGRWTVEMLLIFTLGRPDVLPVDDFGVREGWRLLTGAEAQPRPRELAAIGAAWRPWRSVAAWYLWRAADEAKKVKVTAV